jgi:limonene-1,2-epoxide hydrolase
VTHSAQKATPLKVVAAFGDTWANHDLDGAIALITEDCVFDSTEPAPDGTRYVGRDAIRSA